MPPLGDIYRRSRARDPITGFQALRLLGRAPTLSALKDQDFAAASDIRSHPRTDSKPHPSSRNKRIASPKSCDSRSGVHVARLTLQVSVASPRISRLLARSADASDPAPCRFVPTGCSPDALHHGIRWRGACDRRRGSMGSSWDRMVADLTLRRARRRRARCRPKGSAVGHRPVTAMPSPVGQSRDQRTCAVSRAGSGAWGPKVHPYVIALRKVSGVGALVSRSRQASSSCKSWKVEEAAGESMGEAA